ncbi:MAG: hemolysin family protein [Alphaproteobacteria bacterium]
MSAPDNKPNPGVVGAFLAWLRARRGGKADENTLRESVEELIGDFEEDSTPGEFDEPRLIRNVLKLGELSAEDVMVPRADIVAVEADTTLDNLVKAMSAEAHSRMPVYRANLDDVIGMVHMKDVLTYWDRKEQFSLAQILRKVLFVAPSMRALDLLLEMRQSRTHIALVVDEYGGIDGLITIEDLVEQIVGEIEDEHDAEETPALQPKPDGTLLADARTTLEDFEKTVGNVLTEDERAEIDTLGGLVTALAGRVPRRGELVRHPDGLEFEVLESDARRVRRLRVRNLPRGGTPAPDGG